MQKELSIIDLEWGAKLVDGNIEAAKEMVRELVLMLPADLEKLEVAFVKQDYKKLKDLVHYIKGGVIFCGTPRLKAATLNLEQVIKVKGAEEDIYACYRRFYQEAQTLISEYDKIIKEEKIK